MSKISKYIIYIVLIISLLIVYYATNYYENTNGVIYQAEEGKVSGAKISNKVKGFSGTGYVTDFQNKEDSIEITVGAKKEGLYTMYVGYSLFNNDRTSDFYINNVLYGSLVFKKSTKFDELNVGKVHLNTGMNSIKIANSSNDFYFDYIKLNYNEKG